MHLLLTNLLTNKFSGKLNDEEKNAICETDQLAHLLLKLTEFSDFNRAKVGPILLHLYVKVCYKFDYILFTVIFLI